MVARMFFVPTSTVTWAVAPKEAEARRRTAKNERSLFINGPNNIGMVEVVVRIKPSAKLAVVVVAGTVSKLGVGPGLALGVGKLGDGEIANGGFDLAGKYFGKLVEDVASGVGQERHGEGQAVEVAIERTLEDKAAAANGEIEGREEMLVRTAMDDSTQKAMDDAGKAGVGDFDGMPCAGNVGEVEANGILPAIGVAAEIPQGLTDSLGRNDFGT